MSKKLLAYFSASGVTAGVAAKLAEAAGADLYEIKPEVPYTKADLNWMDKNARSSIEMHDLSFRPAMADKDANIADYDTVFIGFPIWWYIAPTIINTFLEAYDFSGKTSVLFATSGGSSWGETVAKLKDSAPGAVIKKNCAMCLGCLHRCPNFVIQYDDKTKNHGQYLHPDEKT